MRATKITTQPTPQPDWITRLRRHLDPDVISIEQARRRQLSMSPAGRKLVPESEIPAGARESAVCIVLSGEPPHLEIPLIVRGADDGPHSGQIALPGGGRETVDETIEETALRECEEEIALPRDDHEVIGALYPLYLHVSNYRVVPIVTRAPSPAFWAHLRPQPNEVARVLRADLGALYASRGMSPMSYHGADHVVPCYHSSYEIVWGATAMILSELEGVLRSCGVLSGGTSARPPSAGTVR